MIKDFLLLITIMIIGLFIDNSIKTNNDAKKHAQELKKQSIEDTRMIADQDAITVEAIESEPKTEEEVANKPRIEEPKEKFHKTKAFIQKKRAQWE
jgi:hypothetical protein